MLNSFFKLKENNTTVGREAIAGVVTFMAMAYIIFVNPAILSDAMGREYFAPLAAATCLGAGLMTIAMGVFANYPLALAAGMGLNGFIAYGVILKMHLPWQTAMGIVFVEGVIITLLVLTNLREAVMNAIPMDLKRAIGVGIGLFITLIGLQKAGLIIADTNTMIAFAPLKPPSLIALGGLLVMALLMILRVRGALLIGILLATAAGLAAGLVRLPTEWATGVSAASFSTLFRIDVVGALKLGLVATIFAFMITDFFDTMGSVVAVGEEAGFLGPDGRVPRLKRILLVDSLSAVCGGLFGCSSITTYVESAAGVGAGGRTGLASVVTGLLFLAALFFTPVAGIVPAFATAPALILVGLMLCGGVRQIAWDDLTISVPAFLTMVMIPFTFSISKGIGYGFLSYVLLKAGSGRWREIHPLTLIAALLFAVDFWIAG